MSYFIAILHCCAYTDSLLSTTLLWLVANPCHRRSSCYPRFYFVVIPTTSLLTLKACRKLLVHIQHLSISFKEGLSIKLRIQGFYSRRILQYVGIVPVVTHWTGSVQWTWIKTAEDHYDTIAMNEYRTIRAHPAHLDLPKLKKSRANAKNEHGNSWPFSALGQLHQRMCRQEYSHARDDCQMFTVICRTRTVHCASQLWRKNQEMKMNQKKK